MGNNHHHCHDHDLDLMRKSTNPPSDSEACENSTWKMTQGCHGCQEGEKCGAVVEPPCCEDSTCGNDDMLKDAECGDCDHCVNKDLGNNSDGSGDKLVCVIEHCHEEENGHGCAHQQQQEQQQRASDEAAKAVEISKQELMRMSVNTALAIGIHNFPEGLATFVATLNDPSVGAVLAVAIAIHNIPEGLSVAMPLYYATGDRWGSFKWAVISGLAEPVAALLGWAVLASCFSNKTYGILFGMVAGMMVIVTCKELLPTAHRADPGDTVVTYAFITGMCIMALSLVLFIV